MSLRGQLWRKFRETGRGTFQGRPKGSEAVDQRLEKENNLLTVKSDLARQASDSWASLKGLSKGKVKRSRVREDVLKVTMVE